MVRLHSLHEKVGMNFMKEDYSYFYQDAKIVISNLNYGVLIWIVFNIFIILVCVCPVTECPLGVL